jgi:hypothetical protein
MSIDAVKITKTVNKLGAIENGGTWCTGAREKQGIFERITHRKVNLPFKRWLCTFNEGLCNERGGRDRRSRLIHTQHPTRIRLCKLHASLGFCALVGERDTTRNNETNGLKVAQPSTGLSVA